jgi:Methyltransferase domain
MTDPIVPSFVQLAECYINSAAHNDELHRLLTELTWSEPVLSGHRRHVEQHNLGFGDAAFHAMWLRLLDNAYRRFGSVRALEIGVFKGQVISLWALIAKHYRLNIQISALTPLCGQPIPRSRIMSLLRSRLDPRFRERLRNGDFYPVDDYAGAISKLFKEFGLDVSLVNLHPGYSTDRNLLRCISDATFHIIYVDGDHTFEGALHDFTVFGPKVVKGGWLVADDAGCSLPGTAFWKGHEAVSRAANVLPELGFNNVLNVGHNRIYQRV